MKRFIRFSRPPFNCIPELKPRFSAVRREIFIVPDNHPNQSLVEEQTAVCSSTSASPKKVGRGYRYFAPNGALPTSSVVSYSFGFSQAAITNPRSVVARNPTTSLLQTLRDYRHW